MEKKCELCPPLQKKTAWYYEDERFVVCDCETCKVPMIVLKRHSTELLRGEMEDLIWILSLPEIPGGKLDLNRKKIPDHWHCHLR